jgi:hypothetical protein
LRQLSLNHRLDYPLAQQCGQRAQTLRPERAGGHRMARMGGLATIAAALWLWPAVDAGADAWPGRQVKIVVAFAPGGSADQFGRLLAAELSAAFRQQFFVENRPGNSGAIGSAQVARSEPDGYTLLIAVPARTSQVPRSIRISAMIRSQISPISR